MKALAPWLAAVLGVTGMLVAPVLAQDCHQVRELLRQGNSLSQVSRVTGLSPVQVQACGQQGRRRQFRSPQAPLPPSGAAGPAPLGAAGPPPLGAAGPPPLGAAGPPPVGR